MFCISVTTLLIVGIIILVTNLNNKQLYKNTDDEPTTKPSSSPSIRISSIAPSTSFETQTSKEFTVLPQHYSNHYYANDDQFACGCDDSSCDETFSHFFDLQSKFVGESTQPVKIFITKIELMGDVNQLDDEHVKLTVS